MQLKPEIIASVILKKGITESEQLHVLNAKDILC